MATMTEKHSLLACRVEVGFDTQWQLARAARVDQATISHIERGDKVLKKTAYKVFFALNKARADHGLPELRFDELDFKLIE